MPVNFPQLKPALSVPGFNVGVASCGVTFPDFKGQRQDIVLIVSDAPCHAAAVFTQNQIRAVSVTLGENTIAQEATDIRAIVAWAGNTNAGANKSERQWTQDIIRFAADAANVDSKKVLSAWTGICDVPLSPECIRQGMQQAASSMHHNHWEKAANFIRTSDIFPKYISMQWRNYTITGITKGTGMIHPNMKTMLAFVVTDAPFTSEQLQPMLQRVADRSFNCIDVDGHTSTNDTLYLLSSGIGLGGVAIEDSAAFEQTLTALCRKLSQLIVRDGMGASKFVTLDISGAASEADARTIGHAIATSTLVKTAFAGSDANWGRIISAIGNSGVKIDVDTISLKADEVTIFENGELDPDYYKKHADAVFAKDEFTLYIHLGLGRAHSTIWTCDMTHDFITLGHSDIGPFNPLV